jgi:hypothetical protein
MTTDLSVAAAGLPTFTNEQIDTLIDYMEASGRARAHEQGANFNETDFLCGCISTLLALGHADKIPAIWIFDTLGGRSPLGLAQLDQTVYAVYDPRAHKAITAYRSRGVADEHVGYLSDHGNDDVYVDSLPVRHELHPVIVKAMEAEQL